MRLGVKKKAGGSRFWVRKKGEGLWVRKKGLWVRKEGLWVRKEGLWVRKEGLGVRKEGLWVRKEGLWVRKEGLWVRKEGLWVRKEGLWVRKKGCGSEKKGCGSEKRNPIFESDPQATNLGIQLALCKTNDQEELYWSTLEDTFASKSSATLYKRSRSLWLYFLWLKSACNRSLSMDIWFRRKGMAKPQRTVRPLPSV